MAGLRRWDALTVPEPIDASAALRLAGQHARLATEHLGADTAPDDKLVARAQAHAATAQAWSELAAAMFIGGEV